MAKIKLTRTPKTSSKTTRS